MQEKDIFISQYWFYINIYYLDRVMDRYNKLDSFFRSYKIEVQKKNQVVNERENMVY